MKRAGGSRGGLVEEELLELEQMATRYDVYTVDGRGRSFTEIEIEK